MRIERSNPGAFGLIFVLVPVAIMGCTAIPTARYDQLVSSGQSALTTTSETFTRIEKFQFKDVALEARTKPLLDPAFFDKNPRALGPSLRFRENALEALVNYLKLLQILAEKDYQGDVDAAAETVSASAKSLATQVAPDNKTAQTAAGVFATLLGALGTEIVREKRISALRHAMDLAQPDLKALCTLISGDNDALKLFVETFRQRLTTNYNAARPPVDQAERIEFDLEFGTLVMELAEIDKALDGVSAALKHLPEAHLEIRQSLDHPEKTMDELHQLVTEGQRIAKFYRSLK